VHPKNKGKGIASFLVEAGLKEAEKLGVDVFVLAYKAALGLYLRLGFNLVEELIQDVTKWGGEGEYGTYFLVYTSSKKDH
jgi:predicted N-acetyltransferase YhbS